MKSLIISDIHLYAQDHLGYMTNQSFECLDNGKSSVLMSDRLLLKLNVLNQIVETAIENRCDAIIDLGDVTDHLNMPEWLRVLYKEYFILPALNQSLKIFILAGNHGNNKQSKALESFNGFHPNLKVITEPWEYENLMFLPFKPDSILTDAYCKDFSHFKHHTLLTHLTFDGFTPAISNIKLPGLDPKLFDNFEMIISGHLHKPQQKDRIIYIGSLLVNSWGEHLYPHGYGILDDSGLERVITPDMVFSDVVLDLNDNPTISTNLFEFNSITRVTIKGSKAQIAGFNFKDLDWALKNSVSFYQLRTTLTAEDREITNVSIIGNGDKIIDSYTDDENLRDLGKQILYAVEN